jgi:hypothetical protein
VKLDRRAAISIMALAAGVIPTEVAIGQGTPLPKVHITVEMDRFADFTVNYKGKSKTFTTEEVMDALFGSGTFGD